MEMHLFLATCSKGDLETGVTEKEGDALNFSIVRIKYGHFPKGKTCVWAGWDYSDDHSKTEMKEYLKRRFELDEKENAEQNDDYVTFCNGTFFPENLIWDGEYENIIILGKAEELVGYAVSLWEHSVEGKMLQKTFPDHFVYELECELSEHNGQKKLCVHDYGFLYEK